MKTYGEWLYSFTILNFSARWSAEVSCTPRQLYYRWQSIRHLLDGWLGGPQNRSRHSGEDKICFFCQESNPGRSAHRYTDWATSASVVVRALKFRTWPSLHPVCRSNSCYVHIFCSSFTVRMYVYITMLGEHGGREQVIKDARSS
jgi:hypothetical protein